MATNLQVDLDKANTVQLLDVDTYVPNKYSNQKRVNARFPTLYKALLAEPDVVTHLIQLVLQKYPQSIAAL